MYSVIQAVDAAIKKIQQQIPGLNADSPNFLSLTENLAQLLIRRNLLKTYSDEMVQRIEEVNVDINKRIQELEGERAERIANVRHDFEDKVAALPAIPGVEEIKKPVIEVEPEVLVNETIQEVRKYFKRYSDFYPNVSDKDYFFHAALFSYIMDIEKILGSTSFPLSLTNVDRIIHLNGFANELFVILDTSLSVVLINYSKSERATLRLLIYDAESKRFAPLFRKIKNGKMFCHKCFNFTCLRHKCQPQCPICLHTGVDCSKKTPGTIPIICTKCNAFCQTVKCYETHAKICPRPLSELQKNTVEFIKTYNFC